MISGNISLRKNNAPVQKAYPGVFQASRCENSEHCSENFLADLLVGLETACPGSRLFKTLKSNTSDISDILVKFEPSFNYCDNVDITSDHCQEQFFHTHHK